MINKEIKQKDYLRGTKAAFLRNAIGIGFVIITAIISFPAYKYYSKRININHQQIQEECHSNKIKEMFELRSAWLLQHKTDPKSAPTR
ncbi:hypothetical protein Btru_056526 [Bulinus truncatus]|nr:hypothetical protein Btru_056526 [Bulinus truncatus]